MLLRPGCLFIVSCAFFFQGLLWAEEGSGPKLTNSPEEIEIRAQREESKKAEEDTAQLSIIDSHQIKKSPARNLSELLADFSFVQVFRYGGRGSSALYSLRGSQSSQVLILLDGRPLHSAQGEGAELASIALAEIQRIEIIRGPAAARFGERAMGGVINIITKKKGQDSWKLKIHSELARPEYLSLLTSLKGPLLKKKIYSAFLLQGDFSRNFSPLENSSSAANFLSTEDFSLLGAKGRLDLDFYLRPNILMSWESGGFLGSRALPGPLEFPTPEARLKDKQGQFGLGLEASRNIFSLHARAFFRARSRNWEDGASSDQHKNLESSFDACGKVEKSRGSFSFLGKWDYHFQFDQLKSSALLSAGNSLESAGRALRFLNSPALSAELHFLRDQEKRQKAGRLILSPALRFDHLAFLGPQQIWRSEKYLSASLGFLAALDKERRFFLKLNTGNAFRPPSFDDLFWAGSGFAAGNPDLQGEQLFSYDTGLLFKPRDWLKAEAAFFDSFYWNLIQWLPGPGGIWRPSNIARARITGLETALTLEFDLEKIFSLLKIEGSYTFLYPLDKSRASINYNKVLPRRAPHKALLKLSLEHYDGHFISLDTSYQDARYLNAANTHIINDYFLLNAEARVALSADWGLSLVCRNLLDASYVDLLDYPLPGREISVEVDLEF